MLSTRFAAGSALAALATAAALVGCKDTAMGSTGNCLSRVDSAASPAKGVLTLYGNFFINETVMLQMTQNSQGVTVAQGTPASDRTALTLTGLPSGTNTYFIVVSCHDGQDNRNGMKSYFVL